MNNYYSRIKDIYIQFHNYEFFHGPSDFTKEDKRHVGRKELINKIKSYFDPKNFFSGVYLITGFRGIGKTSLVRKSLIDVYKKHKNVKDDTYQIKCLLAFILFLLMNNPAAS